MLDRMLSSDSEVPEEIIDAYAHTVGTVLMVMGACGVVMNSLALIYFIRLKTAMGNSVCSKMAFINLASVDLVLSLCVLCLRGPGFLWPKAIWGTNTNYTNTDFCKVGFYITWAISDNNLLGTIPLSLLFFFLNAPCLDLRRLNMTISIIMCWSLPLVQALIMFIGTETGNLQLSYLESYRRCVHSGRWSANIDKLDNVMFFGAPMVLHVAIWSSIVYFVCRQGNTVYDRQWLKFMKTGLTVVISFTFTWLPYFIIVNFYHWEPNGRYKIVFCFLFSSIIINPVIYAMRSIRFQGTYVTRVVREVFEEYCGCLGCWSRWFAKEEFEEVVIDNPIGPAPTSFEDLSDGDDMVSHQ